MCVFVARSSIDRTCRLESTLALKCNQTQGIFLYIKLDILIEFNRKAAYWLSACNLKNLGWILGAGRLNHRLFSTLSEDEFLEGCVQTMHR